MEIRSSYKSQFDIYLTENAKNIFQRMDFLTGVESFIIQDQEYSSSYTILNKTNKYED